jgi:hypothetical protein
MEQRALKIVNNGLNTNIYIYLEISGGQSCHPYLNVVHFLTPVLIRHPWQLKTFVFMHWCGISAVPLCPCLTLKCTHIEV